MGLRQLVTSQRAERAALDNVGKLQESLRAADEKLEIAEAAKRTADDELRQAAAKVKEIIKARDSLQKILNQVNVNHGVNLRAINGDKSSLQNQLDTLRTRQVEEDSPGKIEEKEAALRRLRREMDGKDQNVRSLHNQVTELQSQADADKTEIDEKKSLIKELQSEAVLMEGYLIV